MIVVLSEAGGEASLPPSCPGCSGRLRPWGYARARQVRGRGGHRVMVRPRRARCRGCRRTHVLLPAVAGVARRADAVEVIGAALLAKVQGRGHRAIAADLARPAATVRGWIRSATTHAERIRANALTVAWQVDPMLDPPPPTGSALGDALAALGTAVAAAIRRLGRLAAPWQLAATITGGLLGPTPRTRGS
ncbi:MAG: helix-turn-helix domain-containing protein [Pseudonocardiaceae bacterium]|nr:helix-turn-helix domain-containing protein [Pseudonocardiaceae bacterium]